MKKTFIKKTFFLVICIVIGILLLNFLQLSPTKVKAISNCLTVSDVSQQTCEALVSISMENSGTTLQTLSGRSESRGAEPINTVCDWQGVTCEGGNIVALDLSHQHLISLPIEVSNLTSLTTLLINNNDLVTLPAGLLSLLVNLTGLDISSNHLQRNMLAASDTSSMDLLQPSRESSQTIESDSFLTATGEIPQSGYQTTNLPFTLSSSYTQGSGGSQFTGYIDISVGTGMISDASNTRRTNLGNGIYRYTLTPMGNTSTAGTILFTGTYGGDAQTGVSYLFSFTIRSGYDNDITDNTLAGTYQWRDQAVTPPPPPPPSGHHGGGPFGLPDTNNSGDSTITSISRSPDSGYQTINSSFIFTANYSQGSGGSAYTGYIDIYVGTGITSDSTNTGWSNIDESTYRYTLAPVGSVLSTGSVMFTGAYQPAAQTGTTYMFSFFIRTGNDTTTTNNTLTGTYNWIDIPFIASPVSPSTPPSPIIGGRGGSAGGNTVIIPETKTDNPPSIQLSQQKPILTNLITSYAWAYTNGITTLPKNKARLYDRLQRYEAAKMLIQFSTSVLHRQATHNPRCVASHYQDAQKFDAETTSIVEKICDLGLMGRQNSTSLLDNFRPYDPLTMDEFTLIATRLLHSTPPTLSNNRRIDMLQFLRQSAQ